MMEQAAIGLGVQLNALVEAADGSTGQVVVNSKVGASDDEGAVASVAFGADVLTFEHEHVPQWILSSLADVLPIRPAPEALVYAQDKLAMRRKLTELEVPCPRWAEVHDVDELRAFGEGAGWPVVLKQPVGGYDGHGVRVVHTAEAASDWFVEDGTTLLAEEKVPFSSEVAALLARRPSGEVRQWPVAHTVQEDGVCSVVTAPAPELNADTAAHARNIAEIIATELDVTGVLAVEMFVVENEDGAQRLLVNELAMRPHNTGHWTIDGAVTSQFENHLRAVLDLPLGDTSMVAPSAVMVNLLGSEWDDPTQGLAGALEVAPQAKVHLYGKEVRPGRKLGHVTVVGETPLEAEAAATSSMNKLKYRD